jgi:NTP pyrophosphatase (non-canonical NTP hydrolase)
MLGKIAVLGADLLDLIEDQATWSQATFGTDKERGPIGALRHLAKEAGEAEEAWAELATVYVGQPGSEIPFDAKESIREELADCLLLLLDASRRSGVKPLDLIDAAHAKMRVNKTRKWATPTSDQPVEHVA